MKQEKERERKQKKMNRGKKTEMERIYRKRTGKEAERYEDRERKEERLG